MNVAFIPVRGGSKSIPLKNIKLMNGKPLVFWTIKAACECQYIDKVYLATDSSVIKKVIEDLNLDESFNKLEIIGRSKESASDTASTEFALLEFASKYKFDSVALIQATSPLLNKDDLNNGFREFNKIDVDSVLSVVPQKRFYWDVNDNGYANAVNYDVYNRPRRQEFTGNYVENGAFYITSKEKLLESQNRISGKIKAVEMNEDSFFEIDEPEDWKVIEFLLEKNQVKILSKSLSNIKMFLTDCDGCLTDAGMYYAESGDELKKFNTRDGMGFARLKEKGILTGVITAEKVELNRRRARKLKLDIFEEGCKNKLEKVKYYCNAYNIKLENIAYIGDDLNDIEVLKNVGLSCCPSDAFPEVKKHVDYITKKDGGNGVIREVAELILNERD